MNGIYLAFNYYLKTLHLRFLRGSWLRFWFDGIDSFMVEDSIIEKPVH